MGRRRTQFDWAGQPAATRRLRALFFHHTRAEIAEILSREFRWSFTAAAIKSRGSVIGLVSVGRLPCVWTPEADARLRRLVKTHTYDECAKILNDEGYNFSARAIKSHVFVLGIRRPENVGQFQPGHTSGCVKRPGWRNSTSFAQRPQATREDYRRGNLPMNVVPLGTVKVRESPRKGKPVMYVKIDAPNPYTNAWGAWVQLSRHTWKQAHGPIPSGHVIMYLDGDTLNCDLDNLVMLTRGELAVLNKHYGAEMDQAQASKSRELQVAVVNLARVHRATHRRKKEL